ncbi:hypothetical protein K0A96_01185, partial [Patescibacteria group bacterium]|nr:hypothetical protein [Patescibacteria group bacterium]
MFEKKRKIINANNYGGFDAQASEYIIFNRKKTPLPWVNICANEKFGTMVTESGSMFTWFQNSYLYRITPRIDDPVLRTSGEIIYLKDDTSGEIWQPTKGAQARHGKGYSVFESRHGNLEFKATLLVSKKEALKMIRIDLTNNSKSHKIISSTYYNQLILGENIESTKRYLKISHDSKRGTIIAQNPEHPSFGKTKVSIGVDSGAFSYELDRERFFGKRGDINQPEALGKFQLSSKIIRANDPCAALSSLIRIPPGKTKSIIFFMTVDDKASSQKITPEYFDKELLTVKRYWSDINSVIEISTPNVELDLLFNHQLLYQIITSRFWGRTGFYQPGGAYGYRDQLQDVIALSWSRPEIAKEHILRAASRQFFGGGVQHWWHPPNNAGVRSLSSDAHLWLVYATVKYLKITGDYSILDEKVPYLLSSKIEHHSAAYYSPESSKDLYSLYEHCVAALNRTIYLFGQHNLPLILSGDWNDSMDQIGRDKRGESVWLAMFLVYLSSEFAPLAAKKEGKDKKGYYQDLASKLKKRLETECWDGEWYLRAYWDSGEKLGSRENDECQIDSLPQSWAAISGLDELKTRTAVNSANKILIDKTHKTVKLFDPPFEKTKYDPGYILLYPPGVRENGGAYTHAAAWLAKANAIIGQGTEAMQIVDYLNPLKRTITDAEVEKYKGEPYVVAADIYTSSPHAGMAGWTWYTGSASVLYTAILENVLGCKLRGDKLFINPSVPKKWREYSVKIKYKKTFYLIKFSNKDLKNKTCELDQELLKDDFIRLKDDG